jgi:cytosine/adenosine deaminase-related metal-dependent hydrolase
VRTAQSLPASGITFVNAHSRDGGVTTLRIVGPRIAALGENPHPGDSIVDLKGDRVLPGLINAHDHLQLNNLPRPPFDKHYRHVRNWISEVDERRNSDPAFAAGVAVARDERLLIGGVKNLLSGVTTVAHHDPLFPLLSSSEFPVQVVQHYGWSHSLYVDGEQQVRLSYQLTPGDRPWIVHAAEGLNDEAEHEFDRLDALGCLGPNTLLVHGIALNQVQRMRLEHAGAGLIWCPSSNMNLFGKTADVVRLAERGRVAIGSDSRLSGARDLLDELRVAGDTVGFDERALETLATHAGARLLRLPDRGALRVDARADLLILPAAMPLGTASRADVRLVMIDGIVCYGDEDCARSVEPDLRCARIRVDGRPKILDAGVAALLSRSAAAESGLELPALAWRAA